MSYSENMAKVVADQLARFVTLNRHQLAGHVRNLDFWIAQARHALQVIDGYQERFQLLKAGQAEYVASHQVTVPWPADEPELWGKPGPPHRVPDSSLREARRSVVDAAYAFLMRLYKDGFISKGQFRSWCNDLGTSVDPADLNQ